MAQSFNQYAAMALDLLDPLIDFVESLIYPFESLVNSLKSLVKVLNKFLVHATSAVNFNSRPSTLSCQ